MSTTVDALRAKAERLAAQLREATANADAEQAAKDARNAERVAAFWANAGDRCQQAHETTVEARAAVVEAAAEGDMVAALAAYPAYVTAHVEQTAVANLARRATAAYVYSEVQQVNPDAPAGRKSGDSYNYPSTKVVEVRRAASEGQPSAQYRTVYGDGVPTSGAPDAATLVALLAEGAARLAESHRASFVAAFTGSLANQLED